MPEAGATGRSALPEDEQLQQPGSTPAAPPPAPGPSPPAQQPPQLAVGHGAVGALQLHSSGGSSAGGGTLPAPGSGPGPPLARLSPGPTGHPASGTMPLTPPLRRTSEVRERTSDGASGGASGARLSGDGGGGGRRSGDGGGGGGMRMSDGGGQPSPLGSASATGSAAGGGVAGSRRGTRDSADGDGGGLAGFSGELGIALDEFAFGDRISRVSHGLGGGGRGAGGGADGADGGAPWQPALGGGGAASDVAGVAAMAPDHDSRSGSGSMEGTQFALQHAVLRAWSYVREAARPGKHEVRAGGGGVGAG